MQVIIVNESSGKSLVRSRRVLSKYLPQIGSTVWAGHISEEGLADLKDRLKAAKISKSSAICCHRIVSRSRTRVVFILGSKTLFDDAGRYSFRQTTARRSFEDKVAPQTSSAAQRFILAIQKLSALAHDTGKASLAFQQKLHKGSGYETLRHDLVSFFVLAQSLWPEKSLPLSDEAWLERVAENPRELVAAACNETLLKLEGPWYEAALKASEYSKEVLLGGADLPLLEEKSPGLLTLLWLVLTHHRLPAGLANETGAAPSFSADEHVNRPRSASAEEPLEVKPTVKAASLKDCLTVAPGCAPWESRGWLDAVQASAASALAALREGVGALEDKFWPLVAAHYLRPQLILSDHLGSKLSEEGPAKSSEQAKGQIFANTKGSAVFGDTLSEHELKVARFTRKVNLLLRAEMPRCTVPAGSLIDAESEGPFLWQNDLKTQCAKLKGTPSFVSIVAETGAGKTLAAAKALRGLTSEAGLRATFALGLRSLTYQTGQALMQTAGLPESDVAIAVGHPETLKMQQDQSEPSLHYGSESADGTEEFELLVDEGRRAPSYDWVKTLCTEEQAKELWGQKALDFLDVPLLACTADHLAVGVSMLKGSDSKLFLRQAHSDLVLDEIDSYSAQDLQTIGKLVFCAGMYGRNVVVMSATLSPHIFNALHEAWRKGLRVASGLTGQVIAPAAVFSSNVSATTVLRNQPVESVSSAWAHFIDGVCRTIEERASRGEVIRKLAVLSVSGQSLDSAYDAIAQTCLQAHQAHAVTHPLTGQRVSTGFIRANTVDFARNLAEYFSTRAGQLQPGQPLIKVVCYHARFPRNYLGVLDQQLSQLTMRKGDGLGLFENKYLQDALAVHPNVMLVVCTTSLIETGRDFDFDWAILDPRSARAEVQAVGRVRRHRKGRAPSSANVWILDAPLRHLQGKAPWHRPGPLDGLPSQKMYLEATSSPLLTAYLSRQGVTLSAAASPKRVSRLPKAKAAGPSAAEALLTDEVLPLSRWNVSFDASCCLQLERDYPANRAGTFEQLAQFLHLTGGLAGQAVQPLLGYLGSYAPLNRHHAKEYAFRDSDGRQVSFVPPGALAPDSKKFEFWSEQEGRYSLAGRIEQQELSTAQADGFLISDLQQQAQELVHQTFASVRLRTSPHVVGCSLACRDTSAYEKKASWHPLLGFGGVL